MHLETFTQPCAERSKSLVEQSEEITVESLLEKNDIQPLGNELRFLVAPQKRECLKHSLFYFLIFEAAAAKELAQKACGWDLTVGDGVEVAEET